MANGTPIFNGLLFPYTKGTKGYPATATNQDIIKSDLFLLLNTRKRERINLPNFGLELERLVFSNTGPLLRAKAFRQIADALNNYEPRVKLVNVQITEETTTVTIDVTYQIGKTFDTVSVDIQRDSNGQ
jgi:hypothetical protein